MLPTCIKMRKQVPGEQHIMSKPAGHIGKWAGGEEMLLIRAAWYRHMVLEATPAALLETPHSPGSALVTTGCVKQGPAPLATPHFGGRALFLMTEPTPSSISHPTAHGKGFCSCFLLTRSWESNQENVGRWQIVLHIEQEVYVHICSVTLCTFTSRGTVSF